MLKLLILACVAVWLVGVLTGGRRRLIRDTTQLTRFILWLAFVFVGGTTLPRLEPLAQSPVLLGLAVVAWFVASHYAARCIVSLTTRR